jgi:hypothetical protein
MQPIRYLPPPLARDVVLSADGGQHLRSRKALPLRVLTPRSELTARRQLLARQQAAEKRSLIRGAAHLEYRGDQSSCIGVTRRAKELSRLSDLDELAGVHDSEAVTDLSQYRHVMAHVEHRHLMLNLKAAEKAKDACLSGNVQSGSGLVQDEQCGTAGQRHCDGHPLLLPPAQLVRITPRDHPWLWKSYRRKQLHAAFLDLVATHGGAPVGPHGLRHLQAHGHRGIEGRGGVLRYNGDAAPPDCLEFALLQRQEIPAFEVDTPTAKTASRPVVAE